MIEIIPNWHPIFVHFTVALFTTAFGFCTLAYFLRLLKHTSRFQSEFEIVGRWCLWSAGLAAICTVLAGLHAFNMVHHDEAGHLVMITHKNFAFTTAALILATAFWSLWRFLKDVKLTWFFIVVLFMVQVLLATTAWYGAELVYRHGIGVMWFNGFEHSR